MYSLHLFDYDGQRTHVFTNYVSLVTTRQLNAMGKLVMTTLYDLDSEDLWQRGRMIEVWRGDNGVEKLHNDTAYFIISAEPFEGDQGEEMIRVTAYDAIWLLGQRTIAYPAASPQARKTGKASDVMKAIVRENLGELCTDQERIIPGFEIDEDTGYGATVDKGFSNRNVLLVLQELAAEDMTTGKRLYFDVVYLGYGKFRFRTFENQRGTDFGRSGSNPKYVGRQYSNLVDLAIKSTGSSEATFIYCGGQGQEDERVIKTAANQDAINQRHPYGRIEKFVDARNEETESAIQSEANSGLNEVNYREYITGRLIDTANFQFGLDYDFGDVLSVEGFGKITDCIVDSVGLVADQAGEKLEVRLAGEIGVGL